MNFQSYMAIFIVLTGLALSVREVAHRKYADALQSGGLILIGGLLLTVSVLNGRAAYAVLLGLGVLGIALTYARRRISRQPDR